MVNSIIYGISPLWITFDPDKAASRLIVAYCDVLGGRESINTNDNGEVNWLEGNITDNPLLVYYYGGDYHCEYRLSEDSPCIDAGTDFFVWEEDTLVNLSEDEYEGNAPDMGAFESPYTHSAPDSILHPSTFILYPAYPNPFNSITTISYSLPAREHVKLTIHDVSGREVGMLMDGVQKAGEYAVPWNAAGFPSGVYFCRLSADNERRVTKLALIR
jgi:hypothetical protein